MKETILVIEDNTEMRENISSILKLEKYHVIEAIDGKQGIDMARKHHPDLILCDIMMPELDGYGVLHLLSKNADTEDIPFIYLTAKAEKEDFRKGMNMGADDYLVKPFDGMDLLKAVEIRLAKNEKLKHTFEAAPKDIHDFIHMAKNLPDFKEIAPQLAQVLFKRKDCIYREGQQPTAVYYIVEGEVKTSQINEDGKEFVTGIYSKGQFFGYVPLLREIPYNESATALTEVVLETIPKSDFQSLVYTNRGVAAQFIKLLSNNVFDHERRLLDMAYHSVRQRVASAILQLYNTSDGNKICVLRRDIAGVVGTALETLNRTVADFREEGLIEILNGDIIVKDVDKLEKTSR